VPADRASASAVSAGQRNLPAWAEQAVNGPTFIANIAVMNWVRSIDTAGGSSWWVNLDGPLPPKLVGFPIYEASATDSAITTGSNAMLFGGFLDDFVIVDRIGIRMIFDPMVLGANRRPTAQGAWLAWWRTGSDFADVTPIPRDQTLIL
jgi:HK97 family phage major capsid protein